MKTIDNKVKDQDTLKAIMDVCVPCRAACPIRTDVPGYIEALRDGNYDKAQAINRRDNIFPGVLGRVCHRPCEPACRHGRDGLGESVQICFLKRAASDHSQNPQNPETEMNNGKKVAVIGSGPSGLTTANDLALLGFKVSVFEQFEQPGGMLSYGIPAFRLPRSIVDADIQSILNLGVELETGVRIDNHGQLDDLSEHYDAVIIAGGCMKATSTPIPGDSLPACHYGLEYMMQANRGQLDDEKGHVVVIGGGFTAVDCARTALRHGADKVSLVYRRTADQLRVGPNEVKALGEEGIDLQFLASPTEVTEDQGKTTLHLERTAVDAQGQFIKTDPAPFTLEADRIIFAIGQDAEDWTHHDEDNSKTEEGYYLTGDFRNGSGTVIEACAAGRKTAQRIAKDLGIAVAEPTITEQEITAQQWKRQLADNALGPLPMQEVALGERLQQTLEVEQGFDQNQALEEAKRCYLCQYRFEIDAERCIYCLKCIEAMPVDCISLIRGGLNWHDGRVGFKATDDYNKADAIAIDHDACVRCGECVRACPVDCISIIKMESN